MIVYKQTQIKKTNIDFITSDGVSFKITDLNYKKAIEHQSKIDCENFINHCIELFKTDNKSLVTQIEKYFKNKKQNISKFNKNDLFFNLLNHLISVEDKNLKFFIISELQNKKTILKLLNKTYLNIVFEKEFLIIEKLCKKLKTHYLKNFILKNIYNIYLKEILLPSKTSTCFYNYELEELKAMERKTNLDLGSTSEYYLTSEQKSFIKTNEVLLKIIKQLDLYVHKKQYKNIVINFN